MSANTEVDKAVRTQLTELLTKAHAHATLDEAVENISIEDVGKRPNNLPYSIWQLVEHIRIAQWDILEFSRDPNHKSPSWPDGYWPKEDAPADKTAWDKALQQIKNDCNEFIALLNAPDSDLYTPFPHGTGQTLLREAMLIADHNSYHTGQIIIIRRLLKEWN